MVEIEIQKDIKEYTPLVSRWFTILVVAICLAIKIADKSVDVSFLLFGTVCMYCVSEMQAKFPSHLRFMNIYDDYVDFVYINSRATKLTLSLYIDGNIEINRSFFTGAMKIVSGRNAIDLPWPCSKEIEIKIKDILASIHNKSSHSAS